MLDKADILTQYQAEISRLRLRFYQPAPETDLLLVNWWATLNETGDMDEIFHPQNRALSNFMTNFAPPTMLMYSTEAASRALNFTIWFTPFDMSESGCFTSIWASQRIRGTRDLFRREIICFLAAFALKKHVYAVTRPKNVTLFSKIGYKTIGTLPGFYPETAGILMHMTLSDFQQSRIFKLFVKEK